MRGAGWKGEAQASVIRADGTLRRTMQQWQDGSPRADIYYCPGGFLSKRILHSAVGFLDVEIDYDRFLRIAALRIAIAGHEVPRMLCRLGIWFNKILWMAL